MEWIATIIVGVLSFLGVVLTNNASNAKMNAALEKAQAITDTKITELTREVREHNNFARRVPVIENDITHLKEKIEDIEKELSK